MIINKQISYTSITLIFTIIFFSISNLDYIVQDNFYNFNTHSWILNKATQPYRLIFYDGIKKILILFVLLLLFIVIFFRQNHIIKEYYKNILLVILSAILVPVIVGGLKKSTNMPCPKNEIHYGGNMIKTSIWQRYTKPYSSMPKIACWPAGHASGGFSLLSLFFLFKTKRKKYIAIITVLIIAWSMGIYKMLIGDHFLSHTIITMLISWLIILTIRRIIFFKN